MNSTSARQRHTHLAMSSVAAVSLEKALPSLQLAASVMRDDDLGDSVKQLCRDAAAVLERIKNEKGAAHGN
jgi:hypothetical protein